MPPLLSFSPAALIRTLPPSRLSRWRCWGESKKEVSFQVLRPFILFEGRARTKIKATGPEEELEIEEGLPTTQTPKWSRNYSFYLRQDGSWG